MDNSNVSPQGRILFSVSGRQIKDFKVALQCLSKIGSELLIEGVQDKLVLRTINTAQDRPVVHAAVLCKHMLATFRTQRISGIVVNVNTEHSTVTVTVTGENRIVKMFCLDCLNSEVMHANIDTTQYPSQVIAEAAELNKLLSSFQSTLDEVTLIANPEHWTSVSNCHRACQLQSFYDPEKSYSNNTLHTSLAIDTRSLFVGYQHRSDQAADVTFNVKDFRSLVTLCEHMGANVILRFDQAGMPLVAEPHLQRMQSDASFKAELILATLSGSQLPAAETHHANAAANHNTNAAQIHQQLPPNRTPEPQGHKKDEQHPETSPFPRPGPNPQNKLSPAPGLYRQDKQMLPSTSVPAASGLMRFSLPVHGNEAAGFDADDLQEDQFVHDGAGAGEEEEDDPEQLPGTGWSPLPNKGPVSLREGLLKASPLAVHQATIIQKGTNHQQQHGDPAFQADQLQGPDSDIAFYDRLNADADDNEVLPSTPSQDAAAPPEGGPALPGMILF